MIPWKGMRNSSFVLLALLLASTGCTQESVTPAANSPAQYGFEIVRVYPHDPAAFTEGLEYRDGFLYESTGLNGKSSLRKVKLETGEVVQNYNLPQEYFGEGITVLGDEIVQLTYKTEVGFVYDRATFKLLRSFAYPGEGWSMTTDTNQIFMSDGTADLRIWDKTTLQEKKRITVHDGATPIKNVNELEWVEGEIYANVWTTDRIVRISPKDGQVTGWIDLAGLMPIGERTPDMDVLNGIAYDSAGKRLFVTGKMWPKLFEIKLVPKRK